MTAPSINIRTFPYRRKWTQEELDEILDRKDRIVEAMTDAQGPVGQMLFIPPDQLHILGLHLALAGGEVRDELAYIVSVPRPPGTTMFEDAREWVVKKEYRPGPPEPDETAAMAKAAAEKIKRQLTPEVREVLATIMADEFEKASKVSEPTRLERAEALVAEAQMREQMKDGDQA